MTRNSTPARERIAESLVELARCSRQHRFIVAGANSPELMFALHRRGYVRVATTTTCGLPHGQYDVALVDWQGRSIKSLETTLDWLVHYLGSPAVMVIWVDLPGARRKPQARCDSGQGGLQRRGRQPLRGRPCGIGTAARRSPNGCCRVRVS